MVTKTKKPCPDAGTSKQDKKSGKRFEAFSVINNKRVGRNRQEVCKIEDYLPHGQNNAITARDLCRISGIGGRRSLQQAVRKAIRDRDVLILSRAYGRTRGYFLPSQDPAEAKREIWLCKLDINHMLNGDKERMDNIDRLSLLKYGEIIDGTQ